MTRTRFQDVATTRLEDAQVLMAAKRFDGAYYFLGHVIEAALKACIAGRFANEILPKGFFHHDLKALLTGTNDPELTSKLDDPTPGPDGQSVSANWATVLYWDIGVRYERVHPSRAEGMYLAVADPVHKKSLVEQKKEGGKRLVHALEDAGLQVRAAFWFFDGESGRWRLVIHFPQIDHERLNLLYGQVQRIMYSAKPPLSIELGDIALASSSNLLIGAVGQIRRTGPDEIVDVDINGPLFPDGVQIDGLHIYRMAM